MRIDGQRFIKWFNEGSKEVKTKEFGMTATVDNQVKDEIKLNVTGKELKEFFELAKKAEMREEKVNSLKEKYENGEYFVTGKDVISKIAGEKIYDKKNN